MVDLLSFELENDCWVSAVPMLTPRLWEGESSCLSLCFLCLLNILPNFFLSFLGFFPWSLKSIESVSKGSGVTDLTMELGEFEADTKAQS